MKILIIYASSESKEYVENLRNRIANHFGNNSILRINTRDRKPNTKKLIKHLWHKDACKMMKNADIIVYIVSPNSSSNKNIDWELKKAMAYKKYVVCLPVDSTIDFTDESSGNKWLNKCLFIKDPFQKAKKCYPDLLAREDDLFKIISEFNNGKFINLFNGDPNSKENKNYLLEQYKIFSDTAESLVKRRQDMNSFYISANTALITVASTVFALSDEKNIASKIIIVLALSLPGLLLNASWSRTLKSYFINHRGKMKILSLIEKTLPASLYDAEWTAMKNRYSKEKYVSFTDAEKKLPYIFAIFYSSADIIALIVLFLLVLKR